jgi:hypothetical protein
MAAMWLASSAYAAIFTVSNNPTIPAQYSEIQAAHDNAQADDTLLLTGSGNNYGYLNASKRLHIVGPGWGGPGLPAYLYSPSFSVGSEGSTVEGVNINYNMYFNTANITLKDSYVYQLNFNAASSNALVRNCVGMRIIYDLGIAPGHIISNCLFNYQDSFDGFQPYTFIDGANTTMAFPSLIANCTFYRILMGELYNTQFSNCVMHSIPETVGFTNGDFDNCINCTFNNSMLYCSSCSFSEVDGGTALVDNFNNTPNPFVNAPQSPDAYAANSLPFGSLNFSLAASNPGINAGTDGTTIGVQGGAYPFASGSNYGGLSGIVPYVSSFIINNPVVPQGGTLDVQATGIIPANQ